MPARPVQSQIQRSADAVVRTLSAELPKLNPVDRRELLVRTVEWLRARVSDLDEARRRAGPILLPSKQETQIVGPFGKGFKTAA